MSEPIMVTFSETGVQRRVIGGCTHCRVTPSDLRNPQTIIVAPSGRAHYPDPAGGDETVCGVDATGDGWWWPR